MSSPFHPERTPADANEEKGGTNTGGLSKIDLDRLRAMRRLMDIGFYRESTDTAEDFTPVPPLPPNEPRDPLQVDPREIRQNYKF